MKELEAYIKCDAHLSLRRQCGLLEINRSNVYYNAILESDENLAVMRLMDEHYLKHPTYGVLQMQDFLFT